MQTCNYVIFFEEHNRKLVKFLEWGYGMSKIVFHKENVAAVQSNNEGWGRYAGRQVEMPITMAFEGDQINMVS